MKICHVITRMILGGAQENTLLTCEGLHRLGHDVTLVTGPAIGPEGELMSRAQAGGYKVIIVDELRREIDPVRDLASYRRLKQIFRELRPDVMHSHSSKAGILARKAAASAGGMKIVHTIHGLAFHRYEKWWKNSLYIVLERSAARYSDAIICVADAMTQQSLEAGVGTAGQYTTIYSGMEIEPYLSEPPQAREFRQSLKLPAGAVLVTQVSRLAELKGHEFILQAASQIKNPAVHFCFVGDGYLGGQIRTEIERLGLAERFHLTGLLPPTMIPVVMHASDVVVHCSLREGLARAIPQAMLAARPVISFDVDGAREVVNDKTGVLLPAGDVAGLAGAIERLAASQELRKELGLAGREKCRQMYDHELMVQRIEQVYARLLK